MVVGYLDCHARLPGADFEVSNPNFAVQLDDRLLLPPFELQQGRCHGAMEEVHREGSTESWHKSRYPHFLSKVHVCTLLGPLRTRKVRGAGTTYREARLT